jgi:hypothetical protein
VSVAKALEDAPVFERKECLHCLSQQLIQPVPVILALSTCQLNTSSFPGFEIAEDLQKGEPHNDHF